MVIVALGSTRLATLACRAIAEGTLSTALATAWQIGQRHGCRWSVCRVGLLGTCAAACRITCSWFRFFYLPLCYHVLSFPRLYM